MKFFFELTSGPFNRSEVRRQLNNSKIKIEGWYLGSKVLVKEKWKLFSSDFYFEVDELPVNARTHMINWMRKIKETCDKI